jgi:hypothetical protein
MLIKEFKRNLPEIIYLCQIKIIEEKKKEEE